MRNRNLFSWRRVVRMPRDEVRGCLNLSHCKERPPTVTQICNRARLNGCFVIPENPMDRSPKGRKQRLRPRHPSICTASLSKIR